MSELPLLPHIPRHNCVYEGCLFTVRVLQEADFPCLRLADDREPELLYNAVLGDFRVDRHHPGLPVDFTDALMLEHRCPDCRDLLLSIAKAADKIQQRQAVKPAHGYMHVMSPDVYHLMVKFMYPAFRLFHFDFIGQPLHCHESFDIIFVCLHFLKGARVHVTPAGGSGSFLIPRTDNLLSAFVYLVQNSSTIFPAFYYTLGSN